MTRDDVLAWFGGSVADAAAALGYTHQAIYAWTDGTLPQSTQDRIVGAMVRAGRWPLAGRRPSGAARARAR